MATDGTKIIDGDLAYDTYWGIMDLYDSGVDPAMILRKYPLDGCPLPEDFYREIYVTSCGLAYWELGLMTPDRLDYIRKVVSIGAGIKEWSEYSEKEGRSRQNVLKRFLAKIEKENRKIRKRKKYRKVTHFVFEENSVLTFQLKNGKYAATLCIKINQYRGNCHYWLVPISYTAPEKPTLEMITQADILGRSIGSGYDRERTKAYQPGIERIWNYVGGNPKFFFGFVIHAIAHKDFLDIQYKFEKIGELAVSESLKKIGSIGGESTFERYDELYSKLEEEVEIFGYQKYPLALFVGE
jgi:hypothetical protein